MYPHLIQVETRSLSLERELQLREELRAARAAARHNDAERRPAAPKRWHGRTGAPRTAEQHS
jgi:hypothetical protein